MQAAPYGMLVSPGKAWDLIWREPAGPQRATMYVAAEEGHRIACHVIKNQGDRHWIAREDIIWAAQATEESLIAREERAARAYKAMARARATIRRTATTANGMDLADACSLIDAMDDLGIAEWYLTSWWRAPILLPDPRDAPTEEIQ